MSIFEIATILIVLTAFFSFLNFKTFRLPPTIGVLVFALIMSMALVALAAFGVSQIETTATDVLRKIDFNEALLHGMLSFLLFAGALQININDLLQQKWAISTLATAGVIVSTCIVGWLTWVLLRALDMPVSFMYCLLFGALISPTDPVAVLGILAETRIPQGLKTKIAGESLFNDGIGVVVFLVLLGIIKDGHGVSASRVFTLFMLDAVGGAAFGLALGILAYQMLKRVNNYQVEILITLALVMGGYALADYLHTSGPIAIVVAGLLIGNHGRAFAMSDTTREHLDMFWELIDQILNAVLFVLIGMEVLVMKFTPTVLLAGLCTIPVVLFARFASVGGLLQFLRAFRTFSPGTTRILVWGGLRGGISVALALSLPQGHERAILVSITYLVVIFSIIIQGLTIEKVVKRSTE